MRNIKLAKSIILVSGIALGCALVTADAFARSGAGGGAAAGHAGGVGGAAAGHAAPSGSVASGHASAAARGAAVGSTGSAGRAHTFTGSTFFHVGHGFEVD